MKASQGMRKGVRNTAIPRAGAPRSAVRNACPKATRRLPSPPRSIGRKKAKDGLRRIPMLDDDRRRGHASAKAITMPARLLGWDEIDAKLTSIGESRPKLRSLVQRLRGTSIAPAADSAPRTLELAVDTLDGMDLFHADMEPAPTPKEEEQLFKRLEFARYRLQDAIRRDSEVEIESRATELQEVTDEIVLRNLRLVIWVLRQSRRVGVPRPDLLQEGILGLLEAVRRYDRR